MIRALVTRQDLSIGIETISEAGRTRYLIRVRRSGTCVLRPEDLADVALACDRAWTEILAAEGARWIPRGPRELGAVILRALDAGDLDGARAAARELVSGPFPIAAGEGRAA
jgi:hypothetical protein